MRVAALLAVAAGLWAQSASTSPVLILKTIPEYTSEARAAGVEGTVLVYAEIGVDGRAHDLRVLRGLGFGLDAKAIDAVHQWRFRPGTKNGDPIAIKSAIEVKFALTVRI